MDTELLEPTLRHDAIPTVSGVPFLGSTLEFQKDPFRFFEKHYRSLGPVFRFRLLGHRPVMLLGPEANRFLRGHERTHLIARPAFERLGHALGAKRFLMAMDGEDHARLRAVYQPGMSGAVAEHHTSLFAAQARAFFDDWANAGAQNASDRLKRLVYRQLAAALTPIPADEEFDDVVRVFDTAMKIGVARVWPTWMKRNPAFARSHRRLRDLANRLVSAAEAEEARNTFVNLVLQAVDEGLLAADDTLVSLLSPYFAGIDTVSATLASAIYALLHETGLYDEIRTELDALSPDEIEDHRVLRKQPKLKAWIQETLRLYSVVILTLRETRQPVVFSGYQIPTGTMLGFCPALPHFLEEHFPEPRAFRLDRWLGHQTSRAHIYQPYGVGAHVCLGAGLAEVQLMTSLAVLVSEYEPSFENPAYRIVQRLDPFPTPHRMGLRVAKRSSRAKSPGPNEP